MISSSI